MATRRNVVIIFNLLFVILLTTKVVRCGEEMKCIFFEAIKCGGVAEVKALLERDPKLIFSKDRPHSQCSVLHLAAYFGQSEEMVRLLIDKGANVNERNVSGMTPLHEAAILCLAHSQRTREGYADIPEPFGYTKKKIAELLISNGANVNAKADNGDTPLCLAVTTRNLEVVKVLIKKGATVKNKNSVGETPLIIASSMDPGNASENAVDIEIIKLLILNGADLNAKTKDGHTPLYRAKSHGNKNIVKLLSAYGAKE